MAKLPEEFKQKWIAALRSGDYKQGTHRLYNKQENLYCCLGVAAVLCKPIPSDEYERATIPNFNVQSYSKDWGVPAELANDSELQRKLWEMNDRDRKSFNEIADFIEDEL